ncbi:MAG: peptidoglycan-binding protein [Acidimicrobiia bacterium]|nr:peptidoglycan-binding protein [Acidimicrobiia bacterium]
MAIKLPYRSESQVSLPQVVRSYGNGKIPDQLLVSCGIRSFKMVEPAARACRAMVAAAAADGIVLDATGTYRSYAQQEMLFKQRYTTSPQSGRKTKKWNGRTYWQKPGVAMAATPGTSKHGLGVTPDLAQRSAAGKLQSVGTSTLAWLAANGPSFGFWNSVKSEAWHWPYFPGDDIPAVVLQMEGGGQVRLQPAVPDDPKRREAFYKGLPRSGVLSKGARGPAVEAVQWALTRAGFPAGIDGDFGPATERAVKEFQTAKKLTVDGLIGANTWAKLGLLADGRQPQEDVTPPPPKPAAKKPAPAKKAPAKKAPAKKPTAKQAAAVVHGSAAAAAAAYRAGFRGDDIASITMIAGRESRWQSDRKNPRTSDRGMWQINWKNLQTDGYRDLRARLGIETDADLLDLDTNAAVAFQMFEDSVRFGEPWFPWRGSETGHDGSGPGWDSKGDHLWHTEDFAVEATAAAAAAVKGKGKAPASATPKKTKTSKKQAAGGTGTKGTPQGSYIFTSDDADGFIAVVGRCLGITDAPWALRSSVATAVAEHNGVTLDNVWRPGDSVEIPSTIEGVRTYTVAAGDGMIAIAKGLGLGRSAAAQKKAAAINAWQGATPHAGNTWYGGAT